MAIVTPKTDFIELLGRVDVEVEHFWEVLVAVGGVQASNSQRVGQLLKDVRKALLELEELDANDNQ